MRLEAGYEPTKRPTRHSGDVPVPTHIWDIFCCQFQLPIALPFRFSIPAYFSPTGPLSSYVFPASAGVSIRFHCLTVVLSLFSTPSSYLLVFIQVSLFLYLSLVSALDTPLPPAPPASGETPLPHPMRIQSDTPTTPGSLLIVTHVAYRHLVPGVLSVFHHQPFGLPSDILVR